MEVSCVNGALVWQVLQLNGRGGRCEVIQEEEEEQGEEEGEQEQG